MSYSMENQTALASSASKRFHGNDKLLWGIILGVVTFWLFAQTTLNIAPDMGKGLHLDASMMNIAVAITARLLRSRRSPRRFPRPSPLRRLANFLRPR